MLNTSNATHQMTRFLPSPLHKAYRRPAFALLAVIAAAGLFPCAKPAFGQTDAPPAATPAPAPAAPARFTMADLQPALTTVQNAITAANTARWKVPNDVRANTQQDVNSMQRDLSVTLPGLMNAADSAQSTGGMLALAPTFAVFRNLDALYDVLLRVSETANIGAASSDASSLEAARASLESGRAKLGTWLLQAIGAQDAQLAQASASAVRPPVAPPPPGKIIVEDGPPTPKPRKRKASAPPAPQ
jgi:hypothetical protein